MTVAKKVLTEARSRSETGKLDLKLKNLVKNFNKRY